MNKRFCVVAVALAVLTGCQPAPQPEPPVSPTVSVRPTDTAAPTASPAPTLAPTVAPTLAPTSTPTAQPTPTPTRAAILQVQVTSPDAGYVNVRDAPSTNGVSVTQAKDKSTLDVLEAADTAKAKIGQVGQWLKVRTPDGKEGFAAAWYLSLPGASPAPAPMPPDLSGSALELFNRTNALRAQNGLAPYRFVNRLAAAAERHSQDMASMGNVSHTGSDGSTAQQRIMDTGYGNWPTDEVIFGGMATVDDAWEFWASDPYHRAVLLDPKLFDIGIAVVRGEGNPFYYTMVFGARPLQAIDPTATPMPTPISVVPLAPTPTPNPALDVVTILLNRTNALRAQNGLPPYQLNDKLDAAAQRHSQDMANTGRIDHIGSDGSRASQRIRDTGYEAQVTGENIYGGVVTVDDAWNYWANDPLHRAVLLNTQYVDMGIGVVKGGGGWYYFTMDLARSSAPLGSL